MRGRHRTPDRARALIEDAGAVGEEINVWVMREDPFLGGPRRTMRYVAEVLNDIGLRAELTIVEIEAYFDVIYGQPHGRPSPTCT